MHKICLKRMPHCTMLHRSKGVFDVADETKVNEVEAVVEAAAAPVKAVAEKAQEAAAPVAEAPEVALLGQADEAQGMELLTALAREEARGALE